MEEKIEERKREREGARKNLNHKYDIQKAEP